MFAQLTDDLLDLTVREKGYGGAPYANAQDEPGCSSSTQWCVTLCTTILCSLCI